MKTSLGVVCLALSSCSPTEPNRLNGSTAECFVESAKIVRGNLRTETERRAFDLALKCRDLSLNGDLSMVRLFPGVVDGDLCERMNEITGMSATELFESTFPKQISDLQKRKHEKNEILQAINLLEITEVSVEPSSETVDTLVKKGMGFGSAINFGLAPSIFFNAKNNSDISISSFILEVTLSSPARSSPWTVGRILEKVHGDLVPGESLDYSEKLMWNPEHGDIVWQELAPRIANRDDLQASIKVVEYEGTGGDKKIVNSRRGLFSDEDQAHLDELLSLCQELGIEIENSVAPLTNETSLPNDPSGQKRSNH